MVLDNELDAALATPALFARHATKGAYQLPPHLRLLDDVCLDAASGGARVCVSVPPRHGKSELLSRYLPAWYVGTFPERRALLASYEADFAASHGARARDLLAEHGGLFGVRLRDDSSARHRWETTLGGGMTTAGVGGP
jgi:hypothetical protein